VHTKCPGDAPVAERRPAGLSAQVQPAKERAVLLFALTDIIGYLINIIVMLVIVQFVLSLLLSFNVISTHNEFVAAVWRAINVLLNPILRPIQRLMPDTGGIDFSPMVLIVLLTVLQKILTYLAMASIQ
jgi:YggT family protein